MRKILVFMACLSAILLYPSGDRIMAQIKGKPVIGISSTMGDGSSASAPLTYVNSVIRAGGVPVVIPVTNDQELLSAILERLDGVIMTGGEDIDPLMWFGEEPHPELGEIAPKRDAFDIVLIKLAVEQGLPVLGICRGEQLINVAFGGTLYQDIPSQHPGYAVKHRQSAPGSYGTHSVWLEEGSLIHTLLGVDSLAVNSFHHQAVKNTAPGFKVTAWSKDGVAEAIEMEGNSRVFGVQFHPEIFTSAGQDTFLGIFRHLVTEAVKGRVKEKGEK